MPEVNKKVETTFTMTMTEEEARWLREYMQNAHGHESERDAKMREKFFNAIPAPINIRGEQQW